MAERRPAAPAQPRRTWGRYRIAAVVVAGAVAVLLIANSHPWSLAGPAPAAFELKSLSVTFTGSGSGGVMAVSVCQTECPVHAHVGDTATVGFTVSPVHAFTGNCSPSVYYTVTKVTESSTGAFQVANVTANSNEKLPVTLPDPLGKPGCLVNDQIWVVFTVVDSGPSVQTPTLQVTVTQS